MHYKVLKLEGLYTLIEVYRKLSNEFGEEKLLTIVKNNPQFLFDILGDKYVVDLEQHIENLKIELPKRKVIVWTEENTVSLIKDLDFTPLQANILMAIHDKKEVNIDYLIDKCRKLFPDSSRKKDRKEGSVIGGALAGLKRKCMSKNIVVPYESIKNEDGILYYTLREDTKDILIKNLKKLNF